MGADKHRAVFQHRASDSGVVSAYSSWMIRVTSNNDTRPELANVAVVRVTPVVDVKPSRCSTIALRKRRLYRSFSAAIAPASRGWKTGVVLRGKAMSTS